MKFYLKKCFIFLAIVLLTLSCFCCTAVEASGIQSRAYFDDGSFSFTNKKSITKFYDGTYMAFEFSATSSSGSSDTITISVYIDSIVQTRTFTVPCDGQVRKFDYISLGSSGGSSALYRFTSSNSSSQINATLVSYSW